MSEARNPTAPLSRLYGFLLIFLLCAIALIVAYAIVVRAG